MNHIIVCAVVSGLYFGVFVSVVCLSDISKKKKKKSLVWGLLIALRKNKQINKCSCIYMAQIRTTAASMHIIL